MALFVGVAGQQGDQRDQVQAAEHGDADHELLQLLLVPLVVLDDLPHVVEGHDARQDEEEADYDAHAQRSQDEVAQGVQVVEAHKANPADAVSFHLVESEQHDGERSRDPPRGRVEPHLQTEDSFHVCTSPCLLPCILLLFSTNMHLKTLPLSSLWLHSSTWVQLPGTR